MQVSKTQVKHIQSLSHKKFRDEAGVFVAEGPKIGGGLLSMPGVRWRQLFAVKEWIAAADAGSGAGSQAGMRLAGMPVQEVGDGDLGRLSALATPNQVVAV